MEKFIDVFELKKSKKLPDDELYVMLMLQRASEGSEPAKADCEDPIIKAACLLESDECPAECKGDSKEESTVVKSGDLAVSASESAGRKILATGTSDMDTLKFKSSEEVEISKVVIERYGYSSNDSVAKVRLENEEGTVISNEVDGLNSKGQANLTIKKDYRKVDGTFNATIVITADSKAGETIGFKVVDVTSSAKNLNVESYKPYTYDVVEYEGAYIDFTVRNTEKTHNIDTGKLYEISKFKIKAPTDSSILVKGFTLTNNGTVSIDKYLDEVEVTVAGKSYNANWSVNKDDELVISFKSDVEVAAKANAEIVVKASFTEDFDEYNRTIQLYIDEAADFSAIDSKTESRVTIDEDVIGAAHATSWPVYKVAGGKVKLTNTKLGNIDAAQNSTDIVVAEGEITVPETIKGTIAVKVNGAEVTDKNGTAYAIEAMRLNVAGDEYEGKKNSDYESTDANVIFTFSNVEIDKGGKIQFLIDTRDTNEFEGKSLTFSIEGNGWADFYYTEGKSTDKIDYAGSISFSRVTIQPAKASLTNSLTKDIEYKNAEQSSRQTVFDGVYTAKKGDVKLNTFTITSKAASKGAGTVNFYLLIDGEEVADMTYEASASSEFNKTDTFTDVEIEAGKTAKIVVEADVNAKTIGSLGKFTLKLEGEDTNGNKAGEASKDTVEMKIVDKGTATVNSSTSKKTVLRAASNAEIAQFTIKPSNGSSELDIDDIVFVVKNGSTPLTSSDIEVTIDNSTEDAVTSATGDPTDSIRYEPSNVTAGSEGVTVRVSLEDETYGKITLDNLIVNGKTFSTSFSNRYEEAVVKIDSIRDLGGTTEFKVNVDADSDVTVKNLVVKFDVTDGTSDTAGISDGVDNGDTFEAKGIQNSVRLVDEITYDVYGSTNITAESHTKCVTSEGCTWHDATTDVPAYYTLNIKKTEFADFFKVGNDGYARTYQSNK